MTNQTGTKAAFRKTSALNSTIEWEPRAAIRYGLALIVFVVVTFWAAPDTAFAQRRATTVDVGKTASYGLLKQVYPRSINLSTIPQGIAEVSLDPDNSKISIRGVSPGSTLVNVSGNYREIVAGSRIGERAVPFRVNINVTVLPRILEPNRRAIDIPVSRGATRTYQIHTFMGSEFTNENAEGVRWRNLRVTPGDNNIGRASRNRMRLRITGVNGGQTTIRLTGERLFEGTWQQVVRDLELKVGRSTTTSPNPNPDPNPNPNPPVDALLDGLKRRYQQLKPSVERGVSGELSAAQTAEVGRNLENLATVVENGIRTIEADPDRSEEGLVRRRILLGDIQKDIRRLKEASTNSGEVLTIGWSSRPEGGNRMPGPTPDTYRRSYYCPPNPGRISGTGVYGTDAYLVISQICPAAVHAGVLKAEGGGTVTLKFRKGKDSDNYVGSTRNGVTTQSWKRNWGSFTFDL